ncbi:MAG: DUF302 domain-containing protein [bacterium]
MSLGFEVELKEAHEAAITRVEEVLKGEGFGVLTRIDVRQTLRDKLGENFRPYTILGACNPPLAHRALTADARVGLMLPCNVTVEALDSGHSLVRIVNPDAMMGVGELGGSSVMRAVATEARAKLETVVEKLRS